MPLGEKTWIGSSVAGALDADAGQSATLAAFGVVGGDSNLELSELARDALPLHSMSGSIGVCRPVVIKYCADKTI